MVLQYVAMGIQWYLVSVWVVFLFLYYRKKLRFFLAGVFFLFECLGIFGKFFTLLATDVQKCKLV